MKGTVNYKGVDFDIEFDYQPEEAQVNYYPDGSGYPGCAAQCELYEIKHKGICFLEILEDDLEDIENTILEQL